MRLDLRPPRHVPLGLEDDPLARANSIERATWAFIGLGVAVRLVTYAMHFPLWGDEAFVAANFLSKGYLDLLQPLDYGQICPLLFLWIELTAVKLFGFNEWSLRLFPTLCSVASVFLFAHVTRRLFRGIPALLAVAIFSVAFYPIRHGAEVKPYISDLLVALTLLALAIEWWRAPERTGWLWLLAGFVPVALALSYPAVFFAGGVSLGLSTLVRKYRRQGALIPFAGYNLALVCTFLGLFLMFTRGQMETAGETLRTNYWAGHFPPLREPLKLVVWLLDAHTGRMFAYPFGGDRGASAFTTFCFLTALVRLIRRRERELVVMALGPFALAFFASIFERYPYGGSARTMLFVAPTICLLTALGISRLIAYLPGIEPRRRALYVTLLILAGSGIGQLTYNVAHPYKKRTDEESRLFARWFWSDQAKDAELVCLKEDMKTVLNPRHWRLFRSALYLCNQRIYSPRHKNQIEADWNAVSPRRPLRCVLYNEGTEANPAVAAWLERMRNDFELKKRQTFVVNEGDGPEGRNDEDRYAVYDFIPKDSGQQAWREESFDVFRR